MKQADVDQAFSDGFLSIAFMFGEAECEFWFRTKSGVFGPFKSVAPIENIGGVEELYELYLQNEIETRKQYLHSNYEDGTFEISDEYLKEITLKSQK